MVHEPKLLDMNASDEVSINGILMKVVSKEDDYLVDKSKTDVEVKETGVILILADEDGCNYRLQVSIEPKDLVLEKINRKENMSPPMQEIEVLETVPVESVEF